MLRISRLVLGLAVFTQLCRIWTSGYETHNQCHHIKTDTPLVLVSQPYIEVAPSSPFTLRCTVCSEKNYKIKVFWERNGSVVSEADGVRLKHKHKSLYQLSVKKAKKEDLGDYNCVVNNSGHKTTKGTFHVGFVPVPPKLINVTDRMNLTQQEIKWELNSSSIIINYEVKFRRAPFSGEGEDWLTLHVPASSGSGSRESGSYSSEPHTQTESYLLRGLEQGTRYQVKVRGRNKFGYSDISEVLTFSTYSPFTTTTTGPTRAAEVINWREHEEFSKKILSNQLPSGNEIISTKRAQELAAFSNSPTPGCPHHFMLMSLLLCLL